VLTLRLFDRDRQPPDWTEIIRPGQYVAFSKVIDTGGSCDQDGRPFASAADATCLLFDSLTEARGFCEEQVTRAPAVRFEIFDSAGRRDPPLLVIVHPSRIAALEGNPRGMRVRKWAASLLLVGAVPLFWYDYQHDQGMLIFPTVLGINMVIIAARLMQLNGAYAHAERLRQKRLAEHSAQRFAVQEIKRQGEHIS
jgi:hypothetical protein